MRYRELGKTGLKVSEIGLGAEWLERHNAEEVKAVIDCCEAQGINILDCWMAEPSVRSNIGAAIAGKRERWIIQGHFGSTWQDGQYVRTRDMDKVVPAFEDLLERLGTGYIDLGMIHFVDEEAEFHRIMEGEFLAYVKEGMTLCVAEDGTVIPSRDRTLSADELGAVTVSRPGLYALCTGDIASPSATILINATASGPADAVVEL